VESDIPFIANRLLERIQTDLLEPEAELNPNSDLFVAGLDSMAIMQLTLIVEEDFGVRLPESLISRDTFTTAQKLAGVVADLKRSKT
jgi:acyl carrier protein